MSTEELIYELPEVDSPIGREGKRSSKRKAGIAVALVAVVLASAAVGAAVADDGAEVASLEAQLASTTQDLEDAQADLDAAVDARNDAIREKNAAVEANEASAAALAASESRGTGEYTPQTNAQMILMAAWGGTPRSTQEGICVRWDTEPSAVVAQFNADGDYSNSEVFEFFNAVC